MLSPYRHAGKRLQAPVAECSRGSPLQSRPTGRGTADGAGGALDGGPPRWAEAPAGAPDLARRARGGDRGRRLAALADEERVERVGGVGGFQIPMDGGAE